MDEINKRLENLERLLESQSIHTKEVLNFIETCQFLELSQSHLYKLTSASTIPYYKPNGKKIYFKREELNKWLLRNRTATISEIETEAANYLINKKRK